MDLLNIVWLCILLSGVQPCSLPEGVPAYTPTERTVLAPVVFEALVLNQMPHESYDEYKACVRVKTVFKAGTNVPDEFCFGRFGPEELCLQHVFEGNSYIFFANTDLTARYDGIPIATIEATTPNIVVQVERGYCKLGHGNCHLPRIDDESFKDKIVVTEGENAAVPCNATGTTPLVVSWTRNGLQTSQRGNSLSLEEVTIENRGAYTCTVRNPAGEVQDETIVSINPIPCEKVLAVGDNETKTIESPSFPGFYPHSKMCSWRVCPPTGKRLEFSFTNFDLRRFDELDIENECDLKINPWRTYCGSVSPGNIVSRCASGCVTLGMASSDGPNQKAKGFQALVTTTDKDEVPFDMLKLFCDSDVVLKVKPKGHLLYSRIDAQVLVNYKPGLPVVGDNVTTYNRYNSLLGPNNLFGCFQSVEHGKDYYVFASRKGERLVSRFVTAHGSRKNPPHFEKKLNSFKNSSPQCP